jgi:PEP-CTERM motif
MTLRVQKFALAASVCIASLAAATPASASLVYDATLSTSAQGFGAAPRVLTIQATGQQTVESGCVGVSGSGGIVVGTAGCRGSDAVTDPNGVVPVGGAETNPQTDNQKFGIPTTGSLGIATAADIGVLFNAVEPGGDGINLTDLTLKFFSSTGAFLGSIDGSFNFSQTEVGNGSAGNIFRISADEQAYVNGLLAIGGNTTTLALEATATNFAGGEESFRLVNLRAGSAVPEPATWAMMLVGFGAMGVSMRRRRRANDAMLQVA